MLLEPIPLRTEKEAGARQVGKTTDPIPLRTEKEAGARSVRHTDPIPPRTEKEDEGDIRQAPPLSQFPSSCLPFSESVPERVRVSGIKRRAVGWKITDNAASSRVFSFLPLLLPAGSFGN